VQLSRYLPRQPGVDRGCEGAFFSTCSSAIMRGQLSSGVHGDHSSRCALAAVQRYGIDWKKRMMFQLLATMEDVHVGLVRQMGPPMFAAPGSNRN